MNAVILAEKLVYTIKTGQSGVRFIEQLAQKSWQELFYELKETNTRKTFWINLYNAYAQYLINKQPPDLSLWKSRLKFFGEKNINIAGHLLSLNDIEHGMLRCSSAWWSFGYLKKIMINDFEKKLRVPLDYRIHFALNCGAISCPAIAFYLPEKVDDQLDDATKIFLEADVKFDRRSNTVRLSSIFNWYRGDFAGKNGILNLLWRHQLIPAGKKIKLRFKEYDWNLSTGNYSG